MRFRAMTHCSLGPGTSRRDIANLSRDWTICTERDRCPNGWGKRELSLAGDRDGKRKIMILLTGSSLKHEKVGGVVHVSKQIMSRLDKDRFNVQYFTNGGWQQHIALEIIRPLSFLIGLLCFLITLIRFRPRLIHINTSLDWKSIIRDGGFLIIARILGFQVLLFIHGWQKQVEDHFKTRRGLIHSVFRRLFSLPDSVIVLSKTFKASLVHLGLDPERIFVVPNMVDCDQFATHSSAEPQRKDSPFTILFMSRFVKKKGVYELIRSIPHILDRGCSDVKLILAGDGEERENMQNLCGNLGIEDRVEFTGYITGQEKVEIMKRADLFVLPTYYGEGLPIVLLEALAAGLPIVTTRAGGIPEVVKNRLNGLLLHDINEEVIAEAVVTLKEDAILTSRMTDQNLNRARIHYDTSVVIRKIEKVYTKTINLDENIGSETHF